MPRKLAALCVLAACLVVGGLFLMADPFYIRAPSDVDLVRALEAHSVAFERLRDMVIEDAQVTASFSPAALDGRLSQKRRAEYAKLFAQIPAVNVVATHRNSARFIFAVGGLLSIGPEWVKGIEWLPTSPTDWGIVTTTLDEARKLPTGNTYLRPAQSQWFLFLQKTD